MPVYVSAVTSMEVFIFHTPRMKLSYLCRIGDNLNPFTQNDTLWFDMCLGAILLNSYVNLNNIHLYWTENQRRCPPSSAGQFLIATSRLRAFHINTFDVSIVSET